MPIYSWPGYGLRIGFFGFAALCAVGLYGIATSYSAPDDDDKAVAESVAAMLRAGWTVISRHQDRINDPAIGDKGLTGKSVLAETLRVYQDTTRVDPMSIDPASRHGRLLRAQMDAIAEVVEFNQGTLNKIGVGFQRLHSRDIRPAGQRGFQQTDEQ